FQGRARPGLCSTIVDGPLIRPRRAASLSKRAWCSGARSSRLTIGFTRAIVALLLAAPAAAPAALTRCSSGSPPAGWERSPSVSELSLVNSGLHRIAHLVGRRHG